jgi:hypothetical protein
VSRTTSVGNWKPMPLIANLDGNRTSPHPTDGVGGLQ